MLGNIITYYEPVLFEQLESIIQMGGAKMGLNTPRAVEFRSIKQLLNRFNANRETERDIHISVADYDVPSWQRQLVWTEDDMGLLAYSIIQNYPIGMIILWRKDDGVRVPIDGRQRLTAIKDFAEGHIAIPSLRNIPVELQNTKYKLMDGDADKGYRQLELQYREIFDDYEPAIVEYNNLDERTAMDIFVKLQGGKSLTKTEIRAALGGRLCDFVTEMTSEVMPEDEYEGEEAPSRHPFFKKINIRNVRKAHRSLCDVLLHEYLYPGQDKHWSSLETMYLDKSATFSEIEKNGFTRVLGKFMKAVQIERGNEKIILPQLRSTFLILSFFKAWKEIEDQYAVPPTYDFTSIVIDYERERIENPEDYPWINFSAALSNAGYAKNRIDIRHRILMTYILQKYPSIRPKDSRRYFTESQKIAIWERAQGRCEWLAAETSERCQAKFADFREADADHIVRWNDGGPTSIENGRLLCQAHNRMRR